jgi:hypothetical protein
LNASINSTNEIVNSWIKDNQIKIYPIAQTSIDEIFKSYFAGTGAFRNKKERDDIPDAVIHDCIVKLSQDEEISVVAKDGVLLNAIHKLDNVNIYKTLSDILEIPELKKALVELNAGEQKVNYIINALNHFDCRSNIEEYLDEESLIDVRGYYSDDYIELPYELLNIETQGNIVEIEGYETISVSSPTYLGNGKFSYTLIAECKAVLSFLCEEDAYESLSYDYRKTFSKTKLDDHNEILVKGSVGIEFRGVLILNGIDETTDSNLLKVHLSYLGAERSKIDCEVNMERIEINDIY